MDCKVVKLRNSGPQQETYKYMESRLYSRVRVTMLYSRSQSGCAAQQGSVAQQGPQ
ncbi:hypothetical protein DENSPDRAFT_846309 [Dentipellis sp. KUC8613]|nr:hypothetical protein DENSPDRAFT_844591 [Dentipellis sp. KUC8613]KAA1479522.1 hypothetical protein DENSPDRAFT_846290 [Dentipellis sp. KUC8613]KAA1479610.1 hypothetical protein DENSPDRAFT_846309 [Dentipellis sp. KUC8613]